MKKIFMKDSEGHYTIKLIIQEKQNHRIHPQVLLVIPQLQVLKIFHLNLITRLMID